MDYSQRISGDICEVAMRGRFTFSDHGAFRKLLDTIETPDISNLTLDLTAIDFIDSAGLGMLLLARDHAEKTSTSLTLRGAQGQTRKMLDVSRFDELFNIV